jgi:hypothetical protein
LGKVKKVVINPNNRRVIAMILPGRYSNSHPDSRSPAYEGERAPERLIVIPVRDLRHLTRNSGFLKINSSEAAKYAGFDPARLFLERRLDAVPYCPEVLFPAVTVIELSFQAKQADKGETHDKGSRIMD